MASAGSVGVGATVGVDEGRRVGVVVGTGVEVADKVSVGVKVGSGVDVGGMSVSVGSGDVVTIGGDVGEAGKTIVLVGSWCGGSSGKLQTSIERPRAASMMAEIRG